MEEFIFDLQRFAFSGGTGLQNDPYIIKTAADLQQLATDVNSGNDYSGTYFKLQPDNGVLDMKDVTFKPIGNVVRDEYNYDDSKSKPFKGTFDGGIYDESGNLTGCYTISNLTISGENYVGLFGNVEGGTIKNVNLTDVNISGSNDVGGVVAYISSGGSVDNCTVSGSVTGTGFYIGGIVGEIYDNGTISNCTNNSTITGKKTDSAYVGDSYVGGGSFVGGIVGLTQSGNELSNCTNTGNVTGHGNVGGIVAFNSGGAVSGCNNSGEVSGTGNYVGGVAGNSSGGSVSNTKNTGEVSGSDGESAASSVQTVPH